MALIRAVLAVAYLFLSALPASAGWAMFQDNGAGVVSNFLSTLKIGAGGWNTGLDVSGASAPLLTRTDTYGAYIWDSGASVFRQLVTQSTMPAAQFGYFPVTGSSQVNQDGGGVYEIASAPSNPSIAYMAFNGNVFKSTNLSTTGTTWTYLSGFSNTHMDANDVCFRAGGRKMAVDPANASVVAVGTDQVGMRYSLDGGTTFAAADASLPFAGALVGCPFTTGYPSEIIVFDPSGGTTTCTGVTVTKNVFVMPDLGSSTHVYKSTTGICGTFSATSGGPTTLVSHMVTDGAGIIWAAEAYANGAGAPVGNAKLWQWNGSVWTQILSTGTIYHAIAVDPSNAAHVVMVDAGGNLFICNSSCATAGNWLGPLTKTSSSSGVVNPVPWITNPPYSYMSSGDIAFVSSTLWHAWGFGTAHVVPPATNTPMTWTVEGAGIEQLISISVAYSGGCAIMAVLDRSTFTNCSPNSYATGVTPVNETYGLPAAWGLDVVGSDVWASIGLDSGSGADYSGHSADNGQTWELFNNWKATVSASALANACGFVQITVPSTTGLSSWANGSGSILTILNSGAQGQAALGSNWGSSGLNGDYPITVVNSTTVCLQNPGGQSWSGTWASNGATYYLYNSTEPKTTKNGNWDIANVVNDGTGKIKVVVKQNDGDLLSGQHVKISGVGGTTEANGDWVASVVSGVNVTLFGSTFTNAYTSGGSLAGPVASGGAIAVDTTKQNIIRVPMNQTYPVCSTDGGQTWAELHETGAPINKTVTTASYSAAAGGTLTYTTSANTNIPVGGGFTAAGMSPSGYNRALTAAAGTTGNTVVAVGTGADPGAISTPGYIFPETGWGIAYFYYNRRQAAADRVNATTIWLYNYLSGWYKVSNCAASAALNSTDTGLSNTKYGLFSGANFVVKSVPGEAGHTFMLAGSVGGVGANHPAGTGLWRYCNGGQASEAPTQVTGFSEPLAIGFAPAKPGSSYPAIYVVAWQGASNTYGVWRSTDDVNHGSTSCAGGNTWTKITDYPLGWMSGIDDITGGATYADFYISNSNGYAYGHQN